MTTPAIMLALLVGPSLVNATFARTTGRRPLLGVTAGCLGVTLVFCFTAVGHFVRTPGMAEMLPPWVPGRVPLVYLSGVLELALAAAVLVPRLRRVTGLALVAMLIAFLSVNVYAAANRVGLGGHEWGPAYLLARVPLQLVLIGWVWWHAVRRPKDGATLGG